MEWLNFIKGLEAWYCSILMTLFIISFRWVFKKKIIKLIKNVPKRLKINMMIL